MAFFADFHMRPYSVSKHAATRWAERFPDKQQALLDYLATSKKLNKNCRRKIRENTASASHRQSLLGNSDFIFRKNKNILFVCKDGIVITVWRWDTWDQNNKGTE